MGTLKRLAVGTFLAVAAGCGYVVWAASQPVEKPRPFDRMEWEQSALRVNSNDPGCFRGGMALDLIDRKVLLGMTRAEATSLLGTPESSTSGSLLYWVGQCGFGWGQNELELTLGADAKVTKAVFN